MKTPREILLERHQEQAKELDTIRAGVIAREVNAHQGRTGFQPVTERTVNGSVVQNQTAISATNGELIEGSESSSAGLRDFETSPASAKDRLEACPTLWSWLRRQRAIWGVLGAAWCAIVVLNVAANSELGTQSSPTPPQGHEALAGYRDYRERLALLLNEPAEEQKDISDPNTKAAPGPRSDADRVRKDASNCLTREWA
ncbi:hypothetical protein GC207_03380 [bacterium]|nr:hypothetical protein [bacterium]